MADAKTPADRIADAVAGLDPRCDATVRAVDLRDACALVPTDKGDDVTKALSQGAGGAIKNRKPGAAARVVLGVKVSDLTHLLGLAAHVNAQ